MFSIGKKILACALLLVLMALLPFTAVKCSTNGSKSENTLTSSTGTTKTNTKSSDDTNEILVGLTSALCNENFSSDAIKAIAILINTDYLVNPEYFDLEDKTVYVSKDELDNSEKEYYLKVENIVKSIDKKTLTVKNKKVFIPYSQLSCGYTLDSEDCEYITSVASPWDCFSKEYDENAECIGVSINGINYLCQNGASAEQALKWYLPEFEIK
ncbi:hypothetical protein [uncultured Ruminococcus sp.]|uniref:hypothetical protein n=1 Tax=uncultured Ruminococcus sp. TaxID=165186 RepID=UPI0026009F84|nr:hypothetical protein [uncultured Ruminococcus sp.]